MNGTVGVVALILAGGSGSRMNMCCPKQYLKIDGIPIIVHTIRKFQDSEEISSIIVVCAKEWVQYVKDLCVKYGLGKVGYIVEGGKTSYDSLHYGIEAINNNYPNNPIVLVHESVRPLVTSDIISENIRICMEHGKAVSAITGNEAIAYSDDGCSASVFYDRSKMFAIQMPQSYRLSELVEVFGEAEKKGIKSQSLNTLMVEMNHVPLFFSKGSHMNIKLTNQEDIPLFEYLFHVQK